jgi:hypothetical protein
VLFFEILRGILFEFPERSQVRKAVIADGTAPQRELLVHMHDRTRAGADGARNGGISHVRFSYGRRSREVQPA